MAYGYSKCDNFVYPRTPSTQFLQKLDFVGPKIKSFYKDFREQLGHSSFKRIAINVYYFSFF